MGEPQRGPLLGRPVRRVSRQEECLKEPEVLTSSVPTGVSRLQQWSNARKGAVNIASPENATLSKIAKHKVVRVRCTWLRLNCLNTSSMCHTKAGSHGNLCELSGNGRDFIIVPSDCGRRVPVSFPEQPQMNGGKERTVNLNASYLCLSKNAGLPIAGQEEVLYGNGVAIVPKVHAVMAWAISNTLVVKAGISGEEPQSPAKTGEGRQFYYQGTERRG